MLRFQRAYEASARVLTSMDQMLDTLINRVGVVGR
jgi:flagellar hook-associated protein 1 FlgK